MTGEGKVEFAGPQAPALPLVWHPGSPGCLVAGRTAGASRSPTRSSQGAPSHRSSPLSTRPQGGDRARPPATRLAPRAPLPRKGQGREGAPEGRAATVMALKSSACSQELEPSSRVRVRPRPQLRPPGTAQPVRGATRHFTSAHTRSWLQGSGDARSDRYVEPSYPERDEAGSGRCAPRRWLPQSPRPPLLLPTLRDRVPHLARTASALCDAYLRTAMSWLPHPAPHAPH
jgi:hypothetical protein